MRATKTVKTIISIAAIGVVARTIIAITAAPSSTCANAVWLVVAGGIVIAAAMALILYVWRPPHPYGRHRSELHDHEHNHEHEHEHVNR